MNFLQPEKHTGYEGVNVRLNQSGADFEFNKVFIRRKNFVEGVCDCKGVNHDPENTDGAAQCRHCWPLL